MILPGSTLEALFWIAVSNFVIPVMLSIAQLVVMWISKDMITVALICIVNIYGEIIGVLLATIWTGESRWREENSSKDASELTDVTIGTNPESTAGCSRIEVKSRTIGI